MHTLTKTPITRDKFEFDNLNMIVNDYNQDTFRDFTSRVISSCEILRKKYLETEDKAYWRALIQLLPESFLQTRTITMSYENLRNMYFQRRNHKLVEWRENFINWIKSLPYAKELIMLEEEK